MREKKWDKYEVALLIEAFLAIEDGADKILTLENLSSKLREIARIDGFDIDEKFRNLNGMQWQLGYIKLILKGVELKNRKAPKIFLEGVQIYKEHREIYLELLSEAYKKIKQGTKEMTAEENKQNFTFCFLSFFSISSSQKIGFPDCSQPSRTVASKAVKKHF